MVNLRSGKKVPFLGRNIPKRSYSYKKPISKEEESELVSKIGSISIHEQPNVMPETTHFQSLAQDNNVNELTYGSMPSLEGSAMVDDFNASNDASTVQSESQSESEDESEIDINAADLPDNLIDIIENFEKEMIKLDENFELMGLLKATTKVMNKSSPAFHDSPETSYTSQNSDSSISSHDMTEDSFLTSDASTIDITTRITKRKKAVFFNISSASSLSSTFTAIDKALESDLSTDEDGCGDVEQSGVVDERKPNFSENSYQEICEMYTEFCQ